MIIWLASYPRSGNTFFRILMKHIYALPTYSVYQESELTGVEAKTELSIEEMEAAPETYFVKTHDLPYGNSPAIYLVRDGRDALISYTHFVLDFGHEFPRNRKAELFDDTLRMMIVEGYVYSTWQDHILQWTRRSAPTVVIRFEDLIKEPLEHFQRAMAEIGYQRSEAQTASLPTFEELHSKVPNFFRKGQVGAWREEMPKDLHNLFWYHNAEAMQKLGYSEDQPNQSDVINSQLAHLKTQNNQIQSKLDGLTQQYTELQNERNVLFNEKSSLLAEFADLRNQHNHLQAQLEQSILYTEGLNEIITAQKHEIDRLLNIENSWGWRFILRLNALRSKIIQPGSRLDRIYTGTRNALLGKG